MGASGTSTIKKLLLPACIAVCLGFAVIYFLNSEKPVAPSEQAKPVVTDDEPPKTSNEPPFEGSLQVFDKERSYPGVNLYPVVGNAQVLLLSQSGEVLHTWNVDAQRARLLPGGNLLVIHGSKWGARVSPWKELKFSVREYGWDGELVWEYRSRDRVHHDVQRLANGNTLFPVRRNLEPQYLKLITNPKRLRIDQIRTDSILEVNPAGKIIWEWKAEDVLDVNDCGEKGCAHETPADWTHINTTFSLPENKWEKQGDERFKAGNILTVLRNWWEMKIIDRSTEEVVWTYNGSYRGGLSGGHDAYMIAEGIPGAGNILVFDNGRSTHKGESIILEIDPTTKEIVWKYEDGKNFFSNSAGSVQRLPNGNTFISEDLSGRVFEVTPEGETVWEYKGNHRIARAHRYPESYLPQ